MNYKYPPIYKYILLLLTIYMFLKHQNIMTDEEILTNSVIIVIFTCIFDYVLINGSPKLLDIDNKKDDSLEDELDLDEDDVFDDDEPIKSSKNKKEEILNTVTERENFYNEDPNQNNSLTPMYY